MSHTVRKVAMVVLAAISLSALSGCIVVPGGGYDHHWHYYDR